MSAAGSPPGDASNLGASTSSSGPRKRGGRAGGASGAGSSSRGGRGRGRGQARAVDDDYEESNKQQQQQAQQQAQQQQAYMYQQQQMQAQAAAQAQAAQAQQQMQQQQAHNEDRPRQSKTERRAGQRLSRRNLFEKDLPTLMYAFGDDRDPLPESVSVLEDIVVDYLSELCKSAAAHSPNAKKVRLDDLRFALRRPQQGKQLARLEELLYLQEDIARARKFMTDATAGIKE